MLTSIEQSQRDIEVVNLRYLYADESRGQTSIENTYIA